MVRKPKHIYLVGWEESKRKTTSLFGQDSRGFFKEIDLLNEKQAQGYVKQLRKKRKKRAIFKVVLHKVMDK